jgi:hypothetical protein
MGKSLIFGVVRVVDMVKRVLIQHENDIIKARM